MKKRQSKPRLILKNCLNYANLVNLSTCVIVVKCFLEGKVVISDDFDDESKEINDLFYGNSE